MGLRNGVAFSGTGPPDKQKTVRGDQTQTVNTLPIKIAGTSRGRRSHRLSNQIVNSITKKKDKTAYMEAE